jgi:hypothetical protein
MLRINNLTGFGRRPGGKWQYIKIALDLEGNPGGTFAIAQLTFSAGAASFPLAPMFNNTEPSPVIISAGYDSINAYRAFDLDPSSCWMPSTVSQQMDVNFGIRAVPFIDFVSITQLAISNYQSLNNFIVSVSEDGFSYTTIINAAPLRDTWISGVAKTFAALPN